MLPAIVPGSRNTSSKGLDVTLKGFGFDSTSQRVGETHFFTSHSQSAVGAAKAAPSSTEGVFLSRDQGKIVLRALMRGPFTKWITLVVHQIERCFLKWKADTRKQIKREDFERTILRVKSKGLHDDLTDSGQAQRIPTRNSQQAQENFKAMRRKFFQQHQDTIDAVQAWEAGDIDGREAEEETDDLVGMCSDAKLNNPLFTCFVDKDMPQMPDDVFYADDDMLIFPNRATHQRSRDGKGAAMSYVHMLIVPRQRIYNAVTLQARDRELLRKMQKKAEEILIEPRVKSYYLHSLPYTTHTVLTLY
jgi:hypothetical protein